MAIDRRVGEWGQTLRVSVSGAVLASETVPHLMVQKPSKMLLEWRPCTLDLVTEEIVYTYQHGDLDEAGDWYIQPVLVTPGVSEQRCAAVRLNVGESLV